jgi:hypothetical protein
LDEVVSAIDELAWLAAVFRLPNGSGLKSSSIKSGRNNKPANISDLEQYNLFLDALELEVDKAQPPHESKSPNCWHPLFREGVLASGFPIAERIEGDGIEIRLLHGYPWVTPRGGRTRPVGRVAQKRRTRPMGFHGYPKIIT